MNSCYLCHFTFLCLSLIFLSDSAASFCFNCLKIAGVFRSFVRSFVCSFVRRFVSKVGHQRYFMGLSCKVKSPWRIAARSALTRPARTVSPRRRQVRRRYGGALSNTLCLFYLLPFFFDATSTDVDLRKSSNFSVFSYW